MRIAINTLFSLCDPRNNVNSFFPLPNISSLLPPKQVLLYEKKHYTKDIKTANRKIITKNTPEMYFPFFLYIFSDRKALCVQMTC